MSGVPDSKDVFHARTRDPGEWLAMARALRRAAEVVWRAWEEAMAEHKARPNGPISDEDYGRLVIDSRLIYVATFLFGLAFENLVKGYMISRVRDLPCSGKGKLHWGVSNAHDLVELFKTAGIYVEDTDKEILRVLTKQVVWKGRYPMPLREADVRCNMIADFGLNCPALNSIQALFDRVPSQLQA
jgi:hypothetical protein